MKKNCKQKLTIRNIINSLNAIMTRSSNIDLDSEIIIADRGTLQEFNYVTMYPVKDIFYGQDKVGIYIEQQKTELSEELGQKIIKEDLLDIVEEPTEEPVQETSSNNWWEKYK